MSVLINLFFAVLVTLQLGFIAAAPQQDVVGPAYSSPNTYLNIADQDIVFNDPSALANKENLLSKPYSDFLQHLYRFDTDKYDHLYGQQSA